MEKYKLFIRQYDITTNDYKVREEIVETNDIYHEIGRLYSTAFTEIKRIDYQKIDEKRELQQRLERIEEYLDNHQPVFQLSTMNQIIEWFDEFYKDMKNIIRGRDNE